jgi:hypothetical protein
MPDVQTQSIFWVDLLENIDNNRVIPVLGSELLRFPLDGKDVSFSELLAPRLGEMLKVGVSESDAGADPVNVLIGQHLARGGRPQEVNQAIRTVLNDTKLATPGPLLKLARIRQFKLFVTTTYDTFMEQAINEARFGGDRKAESLAYSPNDVQDIPCEAKNLSRPTVYHLLGRISATPNYALTEEDRLEFLYSLPTGKKRPQMLFDELRQNHLLLIGNRFPDWLARFFIRLAKGDRLVARRESFETIADGLMQHDQNLVLFLKNFSYGTQIYPGDGAVQFVDELWDRYRERFGESGEESPADRAAEQAAAMPDGAVFISYAHEDREAAEQIQYALELKGVDVWFDKRRLQAGDIFDLEIQRNIQKCSLFLPLVSAHTESRLEGYFRKEWKMAATRSLGIAEGLQFILPVVVDDTPETGVRVPEEFNKTHWSRLGGGKVTKEFADRIVQLVREYRLRQRRSA